MEYRKIIKGMVLGAMCSAAALMSACESQTASEKIVSATPEIATEAAKYLHDQAKQLNDQSLTQVAIDLVNSRDVLFVRQLVDELIYKTRDKQDNKFAVLLAEQGFLIKNDAVMANRAGLEYKNGRYVAKNYKRAEEILNSTALQKEKVAKFYLAEVLLAEDNPNRDPVRGMALLAESAEAGVTAAQEKLQSIN